MDDSTCGRQDCTSKVADLRRVPRRATILDRGCVTSRRSWPRSVRPFTDAVRTRAHLWGRCLHLRSASHTEIFASERARSPRGRLASQRTSVLFELRGHGHAGAVLHAHVEALLAVAEADGDAVAAGQDRLGESGVLLDRSVMCPKTGYRESPGMRRSATSLTSERSPVPPRSGLGAVHP